MTEGARHGLGASGAFSPGKAGPDRGSEPRARILGAVLLVFVAIALPVSGDEVGAPPHPWERVVDYTYRTSEIMPALLLVHLFFSDWMSGPARRNGGGGSRADRSGRDRGDDADRP